MTTPEQKERYELQNLRKRVNEQREQIRTLETSLFSARRERDAAIRELCAGCASKTCTGCRWKGIKDGNRKTT